MNSEEFFKIVRNQIKLKDETKLINYHPFDTKKLTVAEIFNRAASPSFLGAFYRSLVISSNAKAILELGTNLGVGTEYFLNGLNFNNRSDNNCVVTIEGVHDIADFSNVRLGQILKNKKYNVKLCSLKGAFSRNEKLCSRITGRF